MNFGSMISVGMCLSGAGMGTCIIGGDAGEVGAGMPVTAR
jgi:hypothetical protein